MIKKHTLKDSPVYIREFTEDDITDRYLDWFQDSEVTRFLISKNLDRQEVIDHLRYGQKTKEYFMYAIVLQATDQHIGNIKLGPIDRENGVSDLSTIIGETSCWGKGLASAAIKIANSLAFDVHGIRKLSAKIRGDNLGSLKAYTGGDWGIEGHLVDHILIEGQPKDAIVVSCFNTKRQNGNSTVYSEE